MFRKENDIHNLGMKLEDEQAAVSKLQRSIKEDEARMNVRHLLLIPLPHQWKSQYIILY